MPTALIADDEPLLRSQLRARLATLWPELVIVCEVSNGLEALAPFDEEAMLPSPDLCFLDIHMPVLDGYKTLSYLKRDEETKDIPIIFLTNEDFSIEAEKAWGEVGADGYLPKSETHEVMLKKIEEVLKKKGLPLPEKRKEETNSEGVV